MRSRGSASVPEHRDSTSLSGVPLPPHGCPFFLIVMGWSVPHHPPPQWVWGNTRICPSGCRIDPPLHLWSDPGEGMCILHLSYLGGLWRTWGCFFSEHVDKGKRFHYLSLRLQTVCRSVSLSNKKSQNPSGHRLILAALRGHKQHQLMWPSSWTWGLWADGLLGRWCVPCTL